MIEPTLNQKLNYYFGTIFKRRLHIMIITMNVVSLLNKVLPVLVVLLLGVVVLLL